MVSSSNGKEPRLPEPYAFLDQDPPAEYRFRVVSWEVGELEILTRHSVEVKSIVVVRLHIPLEDRPGRAPYVDVTSRRLLEQLRPLLPDLAGSGRYLRILSAGAPPTTTYTVQVDPLP